MKRSKIKKREESKGIDDGEEEVDGWVGKDQAIYWLQHKCKSQEVKLMLQYILLVRSALSFFGECGRFVPSLPIIFSSPPLDSRRVDPSVSCIPQPLPSSLSLTPSSPSSSLVFRFLLRLRLSITPNFSLSSQIGLSVLFFVTCPRTWSIQNQYGNIIANNIGDK